MHCDINFEKNEKNLNQFVNMSRDETFNHRKNKFLKIGRNKGFASQLDDLSTLSMKKNKINIFIEKYFKSKINLGIYFLVFFLLSYLIIFL